MRILVLSNLYPPDFIGGYELGCRQVVDALHERGHEVRVLTTAPRTPAATAFHVHRRLRLTNSWDQYINLHSTSLILDLASLASSQIDASNVHALLGELEEFQPDVVYQWMTNGIGGLGLLACLQFLGMPWVWHLMDNVPVRLCSSGPELIRPLADEFSRQLRGHYIACSQQLVDEIEACGVHLGGDVEIIPNWVTGVIPTGRSAYLPGGKLRVAYAGQIAVHKGVHLIIEAAAALLKDGYTNFSVDIYGNVDDHGFTDLVRGGGLDGHVSFRGSRPQAEIVTLLGDYDVFAFPTHSREPFAFAPLEAASRGCVPIISEICGNAEWMVDGVHCLKTPRNAPGLAAVFRQVIDGQVDLAAMGRRAAAIVNRGFRLEALIPRIERVLARAAAEPWVAMGSPDDAYRLALLAEQLARVVVQEPFCAA